MTRLTYYMHDGPGTFRFDLAGDLVGSDVAKLAQAWRTASSTLAAKNLAVDLTFVIAVDGSGHELLEHWRQAGAYFFANSAPSRALVESIMGQPYASPEQAIGPAFEPRFASVVLRTVLFALVVSTTLLFPAKASAADLTRDATGLIVKSASQLLFSEARRQNRASLRE
jgi:hypothetical protein